jgi:sugar phosphate isomerase/epimerase
VREKLLLPPLSDIMLCMIPVLHSVSYAGVWPGQAALTLSEFLDKAAELGFPAVMLMAKRPHLSPLDFDPDARLRLRDAIEARGLRVQVIAGYNNFSADAEHGDVPHREIQIGHVTELARLAADLTGAKLVRIFTAYEHPAVGYSQLWKNTVDAIRECALRAADLGVTIGVQNHHDLASHHDSLHDLIEAVGQPNCRAMFDAWTPALQGVDLASAARKLGPLTCHTTVADYQLRPRFHYQPNIVNFEERKAWTQAVSMGEGFIDYKAFFAALRASGYQGGVAYEMCSPLLGGGSLENLDAHARRFLAWIKENL